MAEYDDEGNIGGVAIWRTAADRKPPRMVSWRGVGRVFDEKLEWRILDNEPHAATLRIWRLTAGSDSSDHEQEELMILKITASGACRRASLNARLSGANRITRQTADRASMLPCLNET